MLARIATFQNAPSDDRDWVLDAAKGVPGVRSIYHVHDPETGTVLSISFFDDERSIEATTEAIRARAVEIGHQGPGPDEIRTYEVVRYVESPCLSGIAQPVADDRA